MEVLLISKKIIAICIIILFVFLVTGCTDAENIKSEEEANDAVMDVSEDISEISDILDDIEQDLG